MKLVHPSVVLDIIRRHDFRFKKQLGQNFLIDANLLDKIVDAAQLTEEHGVVEIGPGIGTMTELLAERCGKVVAIEKDDRLQPILRETLAERTNVQIVHADVLDLPLTQRLGEWFGNRPVSVVANLPYYITTPIVMKLLEDRLPLESIVIMVQREVAERMAAAPGGSEYGSLSIAVQYYTDARVVCTAPASAFMPRPAVDSAVVRLTIRPAPAVDVADERLFFRVVRSAFTHRRKTMLNNLLAASSGLDREAVQSVLEQSGIDPSRRAQTLSLPEFAALANMFRSTFPNALPGIRV